MQAGRQDARISGADRKDAAMNRDEITWRPDRSPEDGGTTNQDRAAHAAEALRSQRYGAGCSKEEWALVATGDRWAI
jgi:hypothetical protein